MAKEGVENETLRLADGDTETGAMPDESNCDDWPAIRKKYEPETSRYWVSRLVWGQASGVSKRALERMEACLGELPDTKVDVVWSRCRGCRCSLLRRRSSGVGELYQALNDVGFALAQCSRRLGRLGYGQH